MKETMVRIRRPGLFFFLSCADLFCFLVMMLMSNGRIACECSRQRVTTFYHCACHVMLIVPILSSNIWRSKEKMQD